jgi:hypothetical protein
MLKMRIFIRAFTFRHDKQPYNRPMLVDLLRDFLKKNRLLRAFRPMPMGKTLTE